jgi:protein-tyrosine phosphatase
MIVKKVLFVCLGNICRSPAAEGVMRKMVEKQGLASRIHIDSAGTGAWHAGEPPDSRMIQHAKKRGYELHELEARQLRAPEDFVAFDYILTMDDSNYKNVVALDTKSEYQHKIKPLMSFCRVHAVKEVPDPYYKQDEGFEYVLDLLEDSCAELLLRLKKELL